MLLKLPQDVYLCIVEYLDLPTKHLLRITPSLTFQTLSTVKCCTIFDVTIIENLVSKCPLLRRVRVLPRVFNKMGLVTLNTSIGGFKHSKVSHLVICSSMLTDLGVEYIKTNLPNLKTLTLQSARVSDSAFKSLTSMRHLKTFSGRGRKKVYSLQNGSIYSYDSIDIPFSVGYDTFTYRGYYSEYTTYDYGYESVDEEQDFFYEFESDFVVF